MLTDNYILYYYNIAIGIAVFAILGYELCDGFFGLIQYDVLEWCKTGVQKKVVTYMRRIIVPLMLIGLLFIPYVILYFPVHQDIPEFLSGNYSVAEGNVIRNWTSVEKGVSIRGSIEIVEDSTGEIIKFREMYIPYMEKGTHVKIAYLDHCKMGSFLEINGRNVAGRQHTDKLLFGILAVLINIFMFYYVAYSLKKWEWPNKKKYGVFVYKNIHTIILLSIQSIIALGTLIVVGAIAGNYHTNMVLLWTWELIIYLALTLVLITVGLQKITIKEEVLLYCSFRTKYKGTIKDIVKMDLVEKKSFLAKEEQKKSVQLLITMADGTILVVNDMETASNQKFYEKLKNEALAKM